MLRCRCWFLFFLLFFNNYSFYVCDTLFSEGCRHLYFCCQHLLSTPDNSLGSVGFLMRVDLALCYMEGFHFKNIFCPPPALHLDKQVFVSDFLHLFQCSLVRKGENLAWQTSSKDSMTMNLGKSAASPSESDSDRFRLFFFFIKGRCSWCIIFLNWPCAPPPTTESNLGWE